MTCLYLRSSISRQLFVRQLHASSTIFHENPLVLEISTLSSQSPHLCSISRACRDLPTDQPRQFHVAVLDLYSNARFHMFSMLLL